QTFQAFGNAAFHGSLPAIASFLNPRSILTSYLDTVRVAVRAVNNAGAASDTYFTQAYPVDNTGPTELDARAVMRGGSVEVVLRRGTVDPETGVIGIVYAVGSAPGKADIRGWPSTPDLVWSNGLSMLWSFNKSDPRSMTLSSGLPVGSPFYVTVAGMNAAGMIGSTVATGPVQIDQSPPLAPTLS